MSPLPQNLHPNSTPMELPNGLSPIRFRDSGLMYLLQSLFRVASSAEMTNILVVY